MHLTSRCTLHRCADRPSGRAPGGRSERAGRVRILAVAAALLLSACGAAGTAERTAGSPIGPDTARPRPSAAPPSSVDPAPPSDGTTRDAPPDLVVSSDAATSRRRPYTYCWTTNDVGVCVDGQPTADDRVDVRGPLRLSLPLDDWSLTATRWAGVDHPEGPRVPLRTTGTGAWVVAEQLPAGRHVLEIAGRGPEGDAFWAVPITVLDGS